MKIGNSWLTSLVTVVILIIVASGASFSFHNMTQDDQMTGCPIMGMDAICSMSVEEHISAWQSMFSAIPTQILLLLSLLLVVSRPLFRYLMHGPPRFFYTQFTEGTLKIFDPLREAFASGLIHSKAY